ncbi:hypothetical protein BKA93DRAFT_83424 [Sparassis latifolia]|uniref:Uncharacterized protein n=1 Tax=Sparassis crispa TaxID=139825 RepID=A0A401H2A3_9APHY|nr:hypothetical protein SCP_1303540 [Sparassis crispa]GBE88538.1 hypothetical protein SCP_1303540 [Sparassis crispa]
MPRNKEPHWKFLKAPNPVEDEEDLESPGDVDYESGYEAEWERTESDVGYSPVCEVRAERFQSTRTSPPELHQGPAPGEDSADSAEPESAEIVGDLGHLLSNNASSEAAAARDGHNANLGSLDKPKPIYPRVFFPPSHPSPRAGHRTTLGSQSSEPPDRVYAKIFSLPARPSLPCTPTSDAVQSIPHAAPAVDPVRIVTSTPTAKVDKPNSPPK